MDSSFLWIASAVLIAYTTQAMTGFGSVIIAVTLGSRFYPIEFLLPILVPLDVLMNAYIVTKYRSSVDRKILFLRIVPVMGVGLITGISIFQLVQGEALKRFFGLFITLLCLRELYRLLRNQENTRPITRLKHALYILSAGIVQGVFASGGPLVAYALNRAHLSKIQFRSTLAALWLFTNTTLTISYVATGRLTAQSLCFMTLLLPLILVGMVIGERLHHRVNERRFRIVVFGILVLAGISILVG